MNVNPLTNGFPSLSNTKAEQSSAFGVFSVILPGVYLFISSVISYLKNLLLITFYLQNQLN